MAKLDLTPNPFVARVAEGLSQQLEGVQHLIAGTDYGELRQAAAGGQAAMAAAMPAQPNDPLTERDFNLVLGLASAPDVSALITFAGYVGATYKHWRDNKQLEWTVFYTDTRLHSWLLIDAAGIVYRARVEDRLSPSGTRDVLWVKDNTSVGQGSGSLTVQAQFLTGEFTRAADYDLPEGSGTLSAATGVFCEASSAGCCRGQSNKPR